jgi:hypothetical protein
MKAVPFTIVPFNNGNIDDNDWRMEYKRNEELWENLPKRVIFFITNSTLKDWASCPSLHQSKDQLNIYLLSQSICNRNKGMTDALGNTFWRVQQLLFGLMTSTSSRVLLSFLWADFLVLTLCYDIWRWYHVWNGKTRYVILPVVIMLQLSLQWTTLLERLCALCPRDKWWTTVSMVAAWLIRGSSTLWGAVQPWWYEVWLACYRYCCHQRPVWRCCPCSKSQGAWISVNQHAALCSSWWLINHIFDCR